MSMPRVYSASGAELFHHSEVPGARRYRDQLMAWLDAIPDRTHQADLRGRLASSDDANHYSARLEIILDGLFRSRRWTLAYHPPMHGVTTRPDFLVTTPTGRFLCEAVLVLDDWAERRREQRLREIVDGLITLRGPFHVWLRPLTPLPEALPARRIRAFLERELGRLDPSESADPRTLLFEDPPINPTAVIEFRVFLAEGVQDGVVQAWGGAEVREVTAYERIRATLAYKADKYGARSLPYLIVAWVQSTLPVDAFQRERTLFGDPHVVFTLDPSPSQEPTLRRAPNGFFTKERDARHANTHVSAVAFYEWDLTAAGPEHELRLYHNPFTRRPLNRRLFRGQPQLARFLRRDGSVDLRWIGPRV